MASCSRWPSANDQLFVVFLTGEVTDLAYLVVHA